MTKRRKRPPPARSPFCYTGDLVDALGVSRKTLHKYVQMRLLPAPVLVSDGKSGVRCRWTLVALDHVAFILEQQNIGHTLNEIAGMIAARWGPPRQGAAEDRGAKIWGAGACQLRVMHRSRAVDRRTVRLARATTRRPRFTLSSSTA